MTFVVIPTHSDRNSVTITRRGWLRSVLAAGVAASRPVRAIADPETRTRDLVTPQTQRAIERGLAWLALRQHPDGSFGSGSGFGRNVAVTALSGIAFLASGSTPGRGLHGEHVHRAVDFVL
ncbi:MAG TPA: hypothetical protein VK137_05785, partial [Planctomycetaceae bacterium]|nr:hypothetical protein [Planctomycetaceae bacterium]